MQKNFLVALWAGLKCTVLSLLLFWSTSISSGNIPSITRVNFILYFSSFTMRYTIYSKFSFAALKLALLLLSKWLWLVPFFKLVPIALEFSSCDCTRMLDCSKNLIQTSLETSYFHRSISTRERGSNVFLRIRMPLAYKLAKKLQVKLIFTEK